MIEILNDLSPNFCEKCPYMKLVYNEHLGSGKLAFTCIHLQKCRRAYNIGCDSGMKGEKNE